MRTSRLWCRPYKEVSLLNHNLWNETSAPGYKVEGIGYDFVPNVLDRSLVDVWYKTEDKASFKYARQLISTKVS